MTQEPVQVLRCANHPDRETVLRCNRCDKPICTRCAIRTPVGFRCPQCVRGQQAIFFNANRYDLIIVAVVGTLVSMVLGALSFALLGSFGWFSILIAIFAGPVAGGAIGEAIRASVRRRRSRHMRWVGAISCLAGVLMGGALLSVFTFGGQFAGEAPPGVLWLFAILLRPGPLVLGGLAASTIFTRLK